MRGFNQITLVGNVGKFVELRYMQDGKPQLRLSLATNERWIDADGGKHDAVEWHQVEIVGPVAATLHPLVKTGSALLVQGKLKSRQWNDAAGTKHVHTQVRVDHRGTVQLVGGRDTIVDGEPVSEGSA